MKKLLIRPSRLSGNVLIPPSKSISHRAIICASLCDGKNESIINNVIMSEDIKATINAMEALGVRINIEDEFNDRYKLTIIREENSVESAIINCNESGSTLRFLIPIAMVLADKSEFTGCGRLIERPLDTYYRIFDEQGINYSNDSGKLPLIVNGKIKSSNFKIEGDISSQFISGLLFSLPLLEKESKITIINELESKGYVDLTIDMLNKFGVNIVNNNYKDFIIEVNSKYKAANYEVEADYSQGAFFLVSSALGNDVNSLGLNEESIQGDRKIVDIINEINNSNFNEFIIDASQIPDLVPILAVLSSLLDGKTVNIINAKRLRIKESDRLNAITTQLNLLGADLTELEDGIIIKGKKVLKGGATVNSFNDHRIAMSLAIAATRCENEIVLEGYEAVKKSYPNFWRDYQALGGQISELNMG